MFSLVHSPDDLRVYSLSSGSSGNAMLVQAGDTNLLIDAGLPLKKLSPQLGKHGVRLPDLHGILLTHEHPDHCSGAGPMARRTGAPLIANAATLEAYAHRDELAFGTRTIPTGGEIGVGCIGVRSFPVPHDAVEPVGYVLVAGRHQITYFTDAGSRTSEMQAALKGANLAIVEANHDLDWLLRGPYTESMKARVASDTGHLSNLDCAAMIAERLEEDGAMCVWLAHLSRVNNSPSLAKRSVNLRVTRQTNVPFTLEIALRDHPSISWRAGEKAVQLSLL